MKRNLHTRKASDELTRFLTCELDRAAIDVEARTVPLSFSSEAPVERWFGSEILAHAPGSARLGRLNNGGALLVDHDRSDQIGVVESAEIGKDRKGRAIVRFSKSARAQEIFQDVQDGIRRLVSVGYRIHKTETENKSGGVEVVRVTDWEPYEISIVSVPADDSVGVGRNDNPLSTGQNSDQANTMNPEQTTAEPNAPTQPAVAPVAENRSAPAAAVTSEPVQINSARAEIAVERRRTAAIGEIADQMRRQGVDLTDDARRAIAEGTDAEAFRAAAFDKLVARQANYQPSGTGELSRREQRDLSNFSITRGLNALMSGRPLEGLERELHEEAVREARSAGINPEGNFLIPGIMLNHGRRDMTATGGSNGDQGGTFVATTQGSMIDLLYAKMVLRDLGTQFLTGLQGNIDLPKLVTGSTVAAKTEVEAATESSPTTGKVTLSPERAATFVEVSQQLLLQGTPSVEAMIRNDLITAQALYLESHAILAILATSGIGSVAGGTDGAAPTWANIVALETAVSTANADIGSLAYLTNPKVRGKLKTVSKAGTEAIFVYGEGATPLNGYRTGITSQVPSNLVKGTSGAVCSAIVFGNFQDLVIGQWGGMSIMVNPYAKDTEGLVRLTLNTYHDSVVRRAASFAAMKDALTA